MKRHLSLAKRLLLAIAAAFCLAIPIQAKSSLDQLPDSVLDTLNDCMTLVDQGQYETALKGFDRLAEQYPDNYFIQYERILAIHHLRRFDEVIETTRKLMKYDDADAFAYHLCGNALDDSGKTKEALETYAEGIKRFPDAGMLYLETGVIYMRQQKWGDAMKQFEAGIVADPDFASNYYRAAQLLFAAGGDLKVWALVYGETAMLLAPSREERVEELSKDIIDLWKESVTVERSDSGATDASVSLVKSRGIQVDEKTHEAYLDFTGVYEGATSLTIMRDFDLMCPFTASFAQLVALRKGIVENYFEVTDNLFGNSMYLLPYLKSIIDAGHWEAYNFFLFGTSYPDEFVEWYQADSTRMTKFIDWISKHPMELDATHTVSDLLVNRDRRPLNMVEAMVILGTFITDPAKDEDPAAD